MSVKELTVHETGTDGESTYQLVIGRDIEPSDAEELIAKSGGTTVYAMHHYEAGVRVESFISKAMYERLRRSLPSEASQSKPWWAFWR